MFELIDTMLTAVKDNVSEIKLTADNLEQEIGQFPAFVLDENLDMFDMSKIPAGPTAQVYNARTRTQFYLVVDYNKYTKSTLKTLFKSCLQAIYGIAIANGIHNIVLNDIKIMPYQTGGLKAWMLFGTIEFLTRENWTS